MDQKADFSGVDFHAIVFHVDAYPLIYRLPAGSTWGGLIWQAKADALGDACCRELERLQIKWSKQ